ncbi:MAG: hypothetical protein JW990_09120 [Thermoleophilia bacterium]|nr:hypothetical protein [Thermoleophilia bacterium]
MTEDLFLTIEGAHAICLGDTRYPLVFTIAGIKSWAEYKGIAFDEALRNGWSADSLTEADMRFLLKTALWGGEMRRRLLDGDEPRQTDQVVGQIMELAHVGELFLVLARAWTEPPVSKPDPQNQGISRAGV